MWNVQDATGAVVASMDPSVRSTVGLVGSHGRGPTGVAVACTCRCCCWGPLPPLASTARCITQHIASPHHHHRRATPTSCTSASLTSGTRATAPLWASTCTPPGSSPTPRACAASWGLGAAPLRLRVHQRLCSLGACLHAAWPTCAASFPPLLACAAWRSRADRLNAFLEYAVQQPNVFLVTVTQVLDWMKNPGAWGAACP